MKKLPAPVGVWFSIFWEGVRGARRIDCGPMQPSAIRPFAAADTQAVVDLSLRAWEPVFESFARVLGGALFERHYPDWRSMQADAVREALSTNETWVSVAGSTVMGFVNVAFKPDSASAQVYMIAVDPEFQGRSVATALMEFALGEMRARGITMATVGTGGDPGHAPARATYEKLGFTPFPSVHYSMLLDPGE